MCAHPELTLGQLTTLTLTPLWRGSISLNGKGKGGPAADGHLPGGLLSLVKIHWASTWDAELTVSGGWPWGSQSNMQPGPQWLPSSDSPFGKVALSCFCLFNDPGPIMPKLENLNNQQKILTWSQNVVRFKEGPVL